MGSLKNDYDNFAQENYKERFVDDYNPFEDEEILKAYEQKKDLDLAATKSKAIDESVETSSDNNISEKVNDGNSICGEYCPYCKNNTGTIAITNFYKKYKDVIGGKESDFTEWICDNNYATHIEEKYKSRKKYIATCWAQEEGYMTNIREVVVKLDNGLSARVDFYAHITHKGQQHILEYFENKNIAQDGEQDEK